MQRRFVRFDQCLGKMVNLFPEQSASDRTRIPDPAYRVQEQRYITGAVIQRQSYPFDERG